MKQLKAIIFSLVLVLSVGIINAKDIVIEVTQLPQKSQTFLETHFSKVKILYAVKDQGLLDTEYEVRLSNSTKIEFDENGEWKEVDGKGREIPISFIPEKIASYIKEKFPDTIITQIERKTRKYEVELNGDLDLVFSLDGNFVGIDD